MSVERLTATESLLECEALAPSATESKVQCWLDAIAEIFVMYFGLKQRAASVRTDTEVQF